MFIGRGIGWGLAGSATGRDKGTGRQGIAEGVSGKGRQRIAEGVGGKGRQGETKGHGTGRQGIAEGEVGKAEGEKVQDSVGSIDGVERGGA